MARLRVQLDRAGIGAILRGSDARALVNGAAQSVAAGVRVPDGGRVEISEYTTDRAGAAVEVIHPKAAGLQARDGILTAAAAAAGLQVRGS